MYLLVLRAVRKLKSPWQDLLCHSKYFCHLSSSAVIGFLYSSSCRLQFFFCLKRSKAERHSASVHLASRYSRSLAERRWHWRYLLLLIFWVCTFKISAFAEKTIHHSLEQSQNLQRPRPRNNQWSDEGAGGADEERWCLSRMGIFVWILYVRCTYAHSIWHWLKSQSAVTIEDAVSPGIPSLLECLHHYLNWLWLDGRLDVVGVVGVAVSCFVKRSLNECFHLYVDFIGELKDQEEKNHCRIQIWVWAEP